jgi:hypothetical protein
MSLFFLLLFLDAVGLDGGIWQALVVDPWSMDFVSLLRNEARAVTRIALRFINNGLLLTAQGWA